MEARELPRDADEEAAVVMADAFIDDPGWVAVGPDSRPRRHACIRRTSRGVLAVVRRFGGPIWHVERGGRVAGVITTVDPGQWPPPALRSLVLQAPGPLLAGPPTLWRALAVDNLMHRVHPREPHVYVWTLTVAPAFQRQGVGHALLQCAFERAAELDVPTCLQTANPDNLPYYRAHGFRETDEQPIPRGARLWQMRRPAASG